MHIVYSDLQVFIPSTPFPVNEAAEVHHLIAQPRHHPPYEHD